MTPKQIEVLEEIYREHVRDPKLIKEYKIRFLEAMQAYGIEPSRVVETDYDLNVIKVHKSLSHYVIERGTGRYTESSLSDALRYKRSIFDKTLLHYEHNFNKGEYTLTKSHKVHNVDLVEYDEHSLICEKWGVLIDKKDAEKLKGYSVFVVPNHKSGTYVKVRDLVNGTGVQNMHRFILDLPKHSVNNQVVDHINGNTLDNRRSNLRICTQSHNTLNRSKNKPKKYKASSEYMGVSTSNNKTYNLETSVLKQRIRKSGYKNEIKVAKVYDIIQLALAKEYANTNFPKEKYPEKLILKFKALYLKKYKTV